MPYYAHSLGDTSEDRWHLLKDHLEGTSQLAAGFAGVFGAKLFGQAVGLLHDIGKYSREFQGRLKGSPLKVDHSTAGAQEAVRLYGDALGRLLAYAIAGHHAGLPDYGSLADDDSLCKRLRKDSLPRYEAYREEVTGLPPKMSLPIRPSSTNPGFGLQFFIRFLYSCLVDADFLDTEAALDPQRAGARGAYPGLGELLPSLDQHLDHKCSSAPATPVNRWRRRILESCQEKASLSPGLFTLTVPTGGGKTLSSLAFALRHAIKHSMDRVIYVIPFTSIIEQNAAVFRQILGESCVLEHHSNFQFHIDDNIDNSETWSQEQYRLMLSTENWDAPVVVTTNVQFFESLFAAKSSRCRKLHNIANSVVILDEAQMLPTSYLKPCLLALAELVKNYHTTVVLCTATQPAIKAFLPDNLPIEELAPDPPALYEAFRRVHVTRLGDVDDESLAARIKEHRQALCIVNTREHALRIYKLIQGRGAFHLSARMYPVHRSRKLQEIRDILKEGGECRVVSTQLIEAGVDVDFPVVYRAVAGVDSIAQAAGRCNREGRLQSGGSVYLFKPERHGQPRGWLSRTAAVAEMVMRNYDDPLSLEAVHQYFALLYDVEGEKLDEKGIIQQFEADAKRLAFPFRSVDPIFRIIEADMTPIIIPRDPECMELIQEARWSGASSRLSRGLQPYSVQVYFNEYVDLLARNALEVIGGQYCVLKDLTFYSEETGLTYGSPVSTNDLLIF
ncbi:MAG TPA: CRISPR-associated helicase Cas3' [Firmicutes bacterium]|nr:CRISPR-associated helicase Cas3' [Bacillota bacterium]